MRWGWDGSWDAEAVAKRVCPSPMVSSHSDWTRHVSSHSDWHVSSQGHWSYAALCWRLRGHVFLTDIFPSGCWLCLLLCLRRLFLAALARRSLRSDYGAVLDNAIARQAGHMLLA